MAVPQLLVPKLLSLLGYAGLLTGLLLLSLPTSPLMVHFSLPAVFCLDSSPACFLPHIYNKIFSTLKEESCPPFVSFLHSKPTYNWDIFLSSRSPYFQTFEHHILNFTRKRKTNLLYVNYMGGDSGTEISFSLNGFC